MWYMTEYGYVSVCEYNINDWDDHDKKVIYINTIIHIQIYDNKMQVYIWNGI